MQLLAALLIGTCSNPTLCLQIRMTKVSLNHKGSLSTTLSKKPLKINNKAKFWSIERTSDKTKSTMNRIVCILPERPALSNNNV